MPFPSSKKDGRRETDNSCISGVVVSIKRIILSDQLKDEKPYIIAGFNGMQVATNRFVKASTDLSYVQNGSYDEIGSVNKKLGYAQRGDQLIVTTSTSTSTTTTSTSSSSSTSSTTTV